VSGQQHAPAALYPRERTGTHFCERLGGHQDRSGRSENIVPNGIRSRIVQPVVSRISDNKLNEIKKSISTSYCERPFRKSRQKRVHNFKIIVRETFV